MSSKIMKFIRYPLSVATVLASLQQQASAQQFQPLGKTIFQMIKAKDPKNVPTKSLAHPSGNVDVFYTKKGGKLSTLAFVQKGVYPPDCTHTWVVGVNPTTFKVTDIQVVEMSCPHAFPTRTRNFMGQFVGKGPADTKLIKKATIVMKATGSSELTREAVIKSITLAQQYAKSL
jgi:hypothetical protein